MAEKCTVEEESHVDPATAEGPTAQDSDTRWVRHISDLTLINNAQKLQQLFLNTQTESLCLNSTRALCRRLRVEASRSFLSLVPSCPSSDSFRLRCF